MYRGSSFLLKKDYKVHIPIVKIILEERYNPLMGISVEEIRKDSNLYYVESVKAYDISSGKFNIASMKDVAGYYVKHKELFELIRDELNLCGTDYPPMKLMDMCMWQLAYEKDNGAKI